MAQSIQQMEADLEVLKQKATGLSSVVKSYTANGKRVEYRDMPDIELAIARKEREIRIAKGLALRSPWRHSRIKQGWF
jgi:hypothetical protein